MGARWKSWRTRWATCSESLWMRATRSTPFSSSRPSDWISDLKFQISRLSCTHTMKSTGSHIALGMHWSSPNRHRWRSRSGHDLHIAHRRNNLTMRTFLRRLTRLSLGFSKKLEYLKHAVALHFACYNFCRVHKTLRVTPAMEAGITDHIWSL